MKYAIIKNEVCINVCEWDETVPWIPLNDTYAIPAIPVWIGWYFNGQEWVPPVNNNEENYQPE